MNKTKWNELEVCDLFMFECDKNKFPPKVYRKITSKCFMDIITLDEHRFTLDFAWDTVVKL